MCTIDSEPTVLLRCPLTPALSPEGARGDIGHAIEFCERRIDERVIGIETVEHRSVFPDEINNESDRFLEHGLAQFVVKGRETLAIHRVVFFKPAKVEPVPTKLACEIPNARFRQH